MFRDNDDIHDVVTKAANDDGSEDEFLEVDADVKFDDGHVDEVIHVVEMLVGEVDVDGWHS